MTVSEYTAKLSFMLGFPANKNIEGVDLSEAVRIAFDELKEYMKTPVSLTVPYATRIDLKAVGINTVNVLRVRPAEPRLGLSLTSFESGNVFQVAAAVNLGSGYGAGTGLNIDPIVSQLALQQVRNTLSTDLDFTYDQLNDVVYIPHRAPIPATVTIQYVPKFTDVCEIVEPTWQNYLTRLALAYAKISIGRTRSKYVIEGSNVSLDGAQLLDEGNAELEAARNELKAKPPKLRIRN
ncbi:hypothetical protein [Ruminococcus sp.]|uniref:hypothetical protein n=1 Tax=Ruminococcus sp. TaxID=41978 RepID=UPI001B57AB9C|nr:hypothetical protein [Ruminococcus sp.]MBP5433670.1 hypothetical protein [Ruminococcus sp.]